MSDNTAVTLREAPVAKTQMLIRRPAGEVFEAFVDPGVTTKFWFTKSSGRLEEGKEVHWDWEMYGVSTQVRVKAVQRNSRILIDWDEPPTQVEWLFEPRAEGTLVTVANWGFSGDDDAVVKAAMDSMGGFSQVLAGLK